MRDEQGNTPLHFAHNVRTATILLANGADINAKNNEGNTPMHFAALAKLNSAKLIKLFLNRAPALVNAQNKHGIAPLHVAVVAGKPFVTHRLLARGANPNLPDNNGVTPMHLASAVSFFKNERVLKAALHAARGKEITAGVAVASGAVLASIGVILGLWEAVGVGLAAGWIIYFVGLVDFSIRSRIHGLLLASGGNPNVRDNQGNTPLHTLADGKMYTPIARIGGRTMAQRLIAHGADTTLKNNAGRTPYHLAKQNKRLLLLPVINPERYARKKQRKKKFKELF